MTPTLSVPSFCPRCLEPGAKQVIVSDTKMDGRVEK